MEEILCYIIMLVVPYLICGISTAIIVTKIKSGEDIRLSGSGSAGLTNTLRTQGKTAAVLVLFGDVLKGVLSVLAVRFAFLFIADIDVRLEKSWVLYAAGIMACLGHIFPVYFKFKGGKGVLVTCAVLYAIDWRSASILLGLFIIIVAVTRYVSLGSIIAGSCYPACVLVLSIINDDPTPYLNAACGVVIAAILVLSHKKNIIRLINKNEKKLGVSERKDKKVKQSK